MWRGWAVEKHICFRSGAASLGVPILQSYASRDVNILRLENLHRYRLKDYEERVKEIELGRLC